MPNDIPAGPCACLAVAIDVEPLTIAAVSPQVTADYGLAVGVGKTYSPPVLGDVPEAVDHLPESPTILVSPRTGFRRVVQNETGTAAAHPRCPSRLPAARAVVVLAHLEGLFNAGVLVERVTGFFC